MSKVEGAARGRNESGPELIELYRRMLLIREAEKSCRALFAEGAIPGFLHLSDGQEAVSVGVMASLRPDDTIASTHRGHGHALAKGLSLDGFFRELMGKADGACKGRGGSMHVADLSVGMLGANGIVGGGIAIALGSGMAQKRRGGDGIAVSFFGDGALAEGIIHECLNIGGGRNVRSSETGRCAGITDCLHRFFAALSIAITDHDPRAFAGESDRRRAADSGTATGHQCDLAVKLFQEGASKI